MVYIFSFSKSRTLSHRHIYKSTSSGKSNETINNHNSSAPQENFQECYLKVMRRSCMKPKWTLVHWKQYWWKGDWLCWKFTFILFFFSSFLRASLTITKIYSYQDKKLFTWWRHFITTTKILVQIRVLFIWTSLSLQANPPFGGVARSHARAARYRRRECEGLCSPWLESLVAG